jgi:4-hydroxyacetophenone monooxygenase
MTLASAPIDAPADRARLDEALLAADPALLLMSYVQLGGDRAMLDRFAPHVGPLDCKPDQIPEPLVRELRAGLRSLVVAGGNAAAPPDAALLRRMIGVLLGQTVPAEYEAMLLDISRLAPGPRAPQEEPPEFVADNGEHPVVIVGAGTSGICAAAYLQKAGFDVIIFDRNPGLGGTWFENRYPGCGVDTPSHFYSFSFAPNPDWPRFFSLREDVLHYLEGVVDRFRLRPKLRLATKVVACRFDEVGRRWKVELERADGTAGTITARAVVSCVGQLNVPARPAIPGLGSFAGSVVHTAQWPEDLDLRGKRVALIGAGSSALQVGPAIAPEVERLVVYQRSPQWFSHKPDYHKPVGAALRWALRHIPHYARWHRLQIGWASGDTLWPALLLEPDGRGGRRPSPANATLRRQWEAIMREKAGHDPQLIAATLPEFPPLAKRVPVDNGWYDMLRRPNVELVRTGIADVRAHEVATADGAARAADVLVLATGFQASRMLQTMDIRGRGGRSLREVWNEDDPRAHLGVTVPGFPNLFILYGPNTNLGHGGNIIFQAECQANFLVSCLELLRREGKEAIECRPEAWECYVRAVDERIAGMVWTWPGISNWFKNSRGRVTTNSPWRLAEYWAMTREVDPKDYRLD